MGIKKVNLRGGLEAVNDFRLPDMDSPSNWTEEERKAVKDAWDSCIPKTSLNPPGDIVVYGTGGGDEFYNKAISLGEMYYKPMVVQGCNFNKVWDGND